MQIQTLRLRAFTFAAGAAFLAFSGWAGADPPARVARLGYMSGAVSFSPAGESEWVQATINRPLTTGDRLWADPGARAEIQVGGSMIRMNAGTSVSVLNLDDRIAQLQLTQGTLNVRVRRLEPGQVFEVDTPNLAFTLRQPGEFRIEVDADGIATTIVMRKGQGEVYGEGAAYAIDPRQPYRFTGTGLREYHHVDVPRLDEFDRWASDRDRSYDNSGSARYVSQDVVGYQELDANGTWSTDATYGNVWIPDRVAADWAPYRDGHWTWIDPWGWTWVDDAPWGFAVSHYGRWTHLRGTWGWVPGPIRSRAYYAPALVAFVGGNNFQIAVSGGNVGGVAWFPLGPREVYRPAYAVSRGYYDNINRSNTVINNTVINNTYNNYSNQTNVVYANRQVPGAVVAVPTTTFVQSQPVSRAAVRASREMVSGAPIAVVPTVAPTERSVRGAAVQGDKPPPRVFERPVVARTAPPAARAGFAAQQQQLAAKPGKPLDDAVRKGLKPAAAAPAPVVKVVAQTKEAPPTMRPPPAAPAAGQGDARKPSDERNAPATAPAISGAPGTPTHVGAPSQATPPVPAAKPPEQRGKPEQTEKPERPGQPVAPRQGTKQPEVVARPPPTPPVPAAQPPEQRGKPDWSEKAERPGQSASPPQGAKQPEVARPPPPPLPAAQPPQQRGKPEQPATNERRGQSAAPPQGSPQPEVVPRQGRSPQPAAPDSQSAGRSEQRGRSDQRGQADAPPPQRASQTKAVPPQVAPPPAKMQPPPQRPAQSKAVPPVQATPPAPAPQQPAPMAEPQGRALNPAAGRSNEKKQDRDEQKREEENRRQNR